MLKIGDLSRLAQVSVKTLGYYGDLGLLRPAWIDRYTGYRYYAAEQLERLNRILALRDLGFSLEQIGSLLNESVSAEALRGMLRLRQADLERSLSEERARLGRVEARLRQIDREGQALVYPVVIKAIEAQRVLAVQGAVAGYGQTVPLLERLQEALHQVPAGAVEGVPIARYLQQGGDRSLRAEVGIPLAGGRTPRSAAGHLALRAWPAAPEALATLHQGDPEGLPAAYRALLRWASESCYQPTAPGMELYIQGPHEGLPTREWVTEVRVPVLNALESLSQDDKERIMNPEIKTLPAFTVVGQLYRGKNEHGEIPAMWDALNQRWGQLTAIQASGVAYGVCGNMEADGVFEYVAGVEPRPGAAVPEGMVRWEVPAQTYAVFPCTLQTLHQAYEQAYQVWLPGSGYKATGGLDMELYPETCEPEDPTSQGMFIYIPVER